MSEIRSTCLRFNLDKELYAKAWANLQNAKAYGLKSYTQAVACAVNNYFERQSKLADDPYFETREREELFVKEIVSAVEKQLEKSLPNFLAACFIGISGEYGFTKPQPTSETAKSDKPPKAETEPNPNDIDWSFLG